MNSHFSSFAVLAVSAFIVVKLHLVLADETKGLSCEEYYCKCSHPPCSKITICRPTCSRVACGPNYTCIGGKCHPLTSCDGYQCEPGRECFMKELHCEHSNCPKIPSCRPSCQVIRCSSGYICQNGQCIEEKCASIICTKGYKCEEGKCVLDEPSCKGVVCAFGEKCYLEDQHCGYPPCPKTPKCRPSCDLVDCRPGYFCQDGKCLDRCAIVRCQSGYICKEGKCIKHNPICDGIECGRGEECYIDNTGSFPHPACRPILTCATINCIKGYVCKDNKCIPAEPTCDSTPCKKGEECRLQQVECKKPPCYPVPVCVPILTCATILCQTGHYCENNKCIKNPTCEGVKCEKGEECILEQVYCIRAPCPPQPTCRPIDKCSLIRCQSGYQCVDGKCIKAPSCENHHCKEGETCYLQEVQCVRAPCPAIPSCRRLPTCATIKCRENHTCVDSKCVPNPTCDMIRCKPGYECYLEDAPPCFAPPCPPPQPKCRPTLCESSVCCSFKLCTSTVYTN